MLYSVSRENAEYRCDLLTNSVFASSSRVGARHSSIIRSMRACASRTLEIALRWRTRIVNYSRRALLFPYRRAVRRTAQQGYVGIIGPFPQIGMQKESLRTRGFGGRYSRYFAGDFALWRRRNSIRRHSAAPKRELRSQFPLFPLNSKKLSPVCSSLPQFVLVYPNAVQSQKCPRIHEVISGSRFFGSSGSFSWVTLGHGKLRAATYGAHGRYIPREGKAEKPLQTPS